MIWLSICFAFAGPMILSGLYEAMLDNRMLEFLREKVHNQKLTLDMRCRLLMVRLDIITPTRRVHLTSRPHR